MNGDHAKDTALAWMAANHDALSADHMHIWHLHEPSWREYRSAAWYAERLRREGFTVEEGSGGMPTAFCATWQHGSGGPTLGGYAEYDAVPGRSQDPVPRRQPRDGISPYAAGHTDPHSALGIAGLAGFLATKHAMERHGIPGRLKFFGEPAEKMCGSKPVHAARGYYDDLQAAFSFHPHSFPTLTNGVFWDTHSAPYWSRMYTFECPCPETWTPPGTNGIPHNHASARAPGAIDAVCLMYTSSKYMKEAMLPHRGSWSLNEFIPVAGQACADNLAPNIGQIQYALRAPLLDMHEQAFRVLDRNAEHCAAMTHCTVRAEWVTRTRPGLPNHALAALTFRNLERVGPPRWGEDARTFANEMLRSLGHEPMERPLDPALERLCPPEEAEAAFRAQLPSWQMHYAADDYVDYTWHAPTVRLYVARPTLAPGRAWPEWTRLAMGGVPACIDPMWSTAGRVMALTALDLLCDPRHLVAAQAEFRERTGGGAGGSRWVAPLLPPDFCAPIHHRWPEYVTTARGTEWTIPTRPEDTAR